MADVFDLYAKIRLDSKEYEKGIEDAKTKFKGFGNALSTIGSGIGKTFSTLISGAEKLAKVSTAAIGAASTAMTALVKQSLSQYANYEQLVGGVEKIFGKSAEKVKKYADEAYKEAGLSSNQYMEQVTSFSASLLQGLKSDTEKAADIANMAIKDMADNANTYGTDMASIQNAYQAFAKQNYTLLDNLKLGYGGTKGEMARLLNKANEIDNTILGKGVTVDEKFEDVSFAQMIRAIHVIQEELKITGTTQDEAVRTISGSFATMKAAWQNFLTGTGTSEQFVEALVGVSKNVSRQLKVIIPQLTKGLKELVTAIAPELPAILIDILPDIISGATDLLTSFTNMLPQLIDTLAPPVTKGIVMIMSAVIKNLPGILKSLANAVPQVLTTLLQNSGEMLKAGKEILGMIVNGLVSGSEYVRDNFPDAVSSILGFLTDSNAIIKIFDIASEVIENLAQGFIDCLSDENVGKSAGEIIEQLGSKLAEKAKNISSHVGDVLDAIVDFLTNSEALTKLGTAAGDIIGGIATGLSDKENLDKIIKAAPEIVKAIKDGLVAATKELEEAAQTVIDNITDYLFGDDAKKHWDNLMTGAGKIFGFILEGMMAVSELVTAPFSWLGEFILKKLGLYDWYEKGKDAIRSFRQGVVDGIEELFGGLADAGNRIGQGVYDLFHPNNDSNPGRAAADEWALSELDRLGYKSAYESGDSNAQKLYNVLYMQSLKGDANPENFGLDKQTYWTMTHKVQGVPVFGNGGIVTKPTLAMIGEDGAEAVVPLEKDSEIGRKFGGGFAIEKIEVNVNAHGIEDINDIGNVIVAQIDSAMRRYQVQQVRGQGGTTW